MEINIRGRCPHCREPIEFRFNSEARRQKDPTKEMSDFVFKRVAEYSKKVSRKR